MKHRASAYSAILAMTLAVMYGCGRASDGIADGSPESDPVVIRRGNGGDPQTLDPARAEDIHAFNVLTDLYEGLVALDADGNIIAGVAESWDVSDDGLTYTFRLNPAARWSNGETVSADHFITGMRRTLAPETLSAYSYLLFPVKNARQVAEGEMPVSSLGISASDDNTVVIELGTRIPYLLSLLAMPIAYPLSGDAEVQAGRFADPETFVGNGPFVLDEWHPGSHIRLRKNPLFHEAETVTVDFVDYFAITEVITELNMYRAGELDITATVPGSHVAALRKTHVDEMQIAPSLAIYYLAFDLSEPPLDDPRLRKALSAAIDRRAVVDLLSRGEQPAFGLVPYGVYDYEPARFEWATLLQPQRESLAQRLYRRAGYSQDDPLHLKLTYDSGDIHETVALAVSSMWHDVLGIEVELDKREWQHFLATRENRSDWQVMRFAWTGDFNHPATFADILHSISRQNLPGYSSSAYDELLAAAEAAADPEEQMRLFAAAEAEMLEDDPIAPLYFYVSKHLVTPTVSGFRSNVLDRHPSRYLHKIPERSGR